MCSMIYRILLLLLLSYLEHHPVSCSGDHSKHLSSVNLTTSNCSPICKSNQSTDSGDLINGNGKLLQLIASAAGQSSARFRRAVTSRPERKWHNGIIPYEIEPYKFTDRQLSLFKQAMEVWERHTCIKFVERKPEHLDYVVFTERKCGCCSYIGKKGGIQDISLAEGCAKLGLILHEYGHLVGFWHEHTRPDRDQHVEIIPDNIQDDQTHNFGKMDRTEIDSLGSPYDFYSIMHYSTNTFSQSYFKDTIRPKHRVEIESEIGQRERLSRQDIKQANLLYRCPLNGVTLQKPKGSIELNDANQIEKDPLYREWRIAAPSISQHIWLRIEEATFSSFKNQSCEESYLLILDGYDPDTAPAIQKLCTNTIASFPMEIRSKTNRMLIIYKKSKQNIGGNLNFKASYEFKCGGRLTEKSGIIQSPGYPLPYATNANCEWSIQVEPKHKILLNFARFDLVNNVNCLTDYLEIYEIHNEIHNDGEASKLIGKFCASKIPDVIQSTSNELLIRFVSDGFNSNVARYGFNATYAADLDECELGLHDCEELCFNVQNGYRCGCEIGSELASNKRGCIKTCGGILNVLNNGVIQSPGYEYNEYKNFLHCKWELRASPNHSIFVNFSDFDLEENIRCVADSLTIKEGSKRLGKFCGSQVPSPLLSDGNKLEIEFNTDKADTRRGFSLSYFIDQNECSINNGGCDHECINKFNTYECRCAKGFVLKADQRSCKRLPCKHHFKTPRGTFQSIDFFNTNISSVDCYWILETLPGNSISSTFTFNSRPPQTAACSESNLVVYDGSTPQNAVLYKSADTTAKQIKGTKNALLITYYSTPKCPFSGFQTSFASACGGNYVATSKPQFIYSHPEFGRAPYRPFLECKWQIKAKHAKQIRIRFKTLEIEEDGERCRYDRLTIYEGSSEEPGKQLHVYCGNQLPSEIVSNGDSLFIKFTTDETRNREGFALIYDEVN